MFSEIYGIDSEEIFHFSEKVNAVSKQDLQELAEDLFTKPQVIALVGPDNPLSNQ